MRRRGFVGVAISALVIASSAHAQVASSYNNPVVPEVTQKPLAGYDNGFILRSADEAFALKIAARSQFQHQYRNIRQAGQVDTNTFVMRRARFYLLGTIFKNFDFSLWLNHGTHPTAPSNTYWWADMTARIVPEFNITAGMTTMPIDRFGETSSGKYAFVEAPITATQEDGIQDRTIARQAFSNPETLGIRLWGDISRFHYILGVGNGDARQIFNQTRAFAYGARVWVDLIGNPGYDETDFAYTETPGFAIGAGTSFDPQDATDANINNVTLNWAWTSSGDMILKWRGLSLLGEAYFRRAKVTTGNFTLDDFGYRGQVGYFVLPKKLELVARGVQIYREGPDNNVYEFGGGLNWYIEGHNIKLQVDYSRLKDYDATIGTGGIATDRFRTMLTFQI
ncbi:MAG: hypothetical protein HYV02_07550 [Deltaproteobacteria bacterium]|nr:hypothetical protein [Deltaproteobacteria bacterium]